MAIAHMNWGRLLYPLDHPEMADFENALDGVFALAERHPGFVWRMSDEATASELGQLGYDERMSATVSVWKSIEALRDFAFRSRHGAYVNARDRWFEPAKPPQLVLWQVAAETRPTFEEAFQRLEILKREGPSSEAHGWPKT